ncbi:MAG: hypothetical protein IIX39_04990, partial [Clostridia bacterium]|nr:hypothetical protein [Clostridia bacterium]
LLNAKKSCISPRLVSKETIFTQNTSYKFVSYIIPIENKTNNFNDEDISSLCWYWYNDDIYLMIDSQKKIDKNIVLPEYMTDMRIENLDVYGAEITQPKLKENSLNIKTNSDKGYAVIRVS